MALTQFRNFSAMQADERLYDIFDFDKRFIMRAPMRTLQRAFTLADAALDRVYRECIGAELECTLHFDERVPVALWRVLYVRAALGMTSPDYEGRDYVKDIG